MSRRSQGIAAFVVATVSVLVAAFLMCGPRLEGQTRESTLDSEREEGEAGRPRSVTKSLPRSRRVGSEERARLLREIRQRLSAPSHPGTDEVPEPTRQFEKRAPSSPVEPAIRDRTGGELEAVAAALHEDFMPLADECYARAREGDPDLEGMLDIQMKIIADEEVGGLVESFEYGEENQLEDPALTECIRETMLSTIFPSPGESGERGVRLTLVLSPDED